MKTISALAKDLHQLDSVSSKNKLVVSSFGERLANRTQRNPDEQPQKAY
jgi:hypothetical protein